MTMNNSSPLAHIMQEMLVFNPVVQTFSHPFMDGCTKDESNAIPCQRVRFQLSIGTDISISPEVVLLKNRLSSVFFPSVHVPEGDINGCVNVS
jgi:hypothetical protein